MEPNISIKFFIRKTVNLNERVMALAIDDNTREAVASASGYNIDNAFENLHKAMMEE